jgi:hypothetical protein
MTASSSPRTRRVLPLIIAIGVGALALGPVRAASRAAPDPLATMLSDDWSESMRAAVIERLHALGGAACATLSGYSAAQDARAREHAVRAMDLDGCETIEDYRPYFADHAPWVVDAVIAAVGGRRIVAALPFVLQHVDDRRRLVSDDGTWTIEEAAHRALRHLTGQPIPFEAEDPPASRDHAAAAWRAWMAAHGSEPPAAWLASGHEAARAALQGTDPAARMAALETLALADAAGQEILRDALLRAPGEIEATLVCLPEEPPRVTETVPCALTLRNVAARRIPLALGDPVIDLASATAAAVAAPPPEPESSGAKRGAKGSGATKGKNAPAPAAPPATAPTVAAANLIGRFVDLAPGAAKTLQLVAGPVQNAGRFVVRVTVRDLGTALAGAPRTLPDRLEATTGLRFEQ